jgi:hypothetical protein
MVCTAALLLSIKLSPLRRHRHRLGKFLVAMITHGLTDHLEEYPNSAGAGNAFGSSDAGNFLSLLKALRTSLGLLLRCPFLSVLLGIRVVKNHICGSDGSPVAWFERHPPCRCLGICFPAHVCQLVRFCSPFFWLRVLIHLEDEL